MANVSAFVATRNLFADYIQYQHALSYEEWLALPDEHKQPALFTQFFDNICQAWHKANAYNFIPSEDGVSTVCRYLEKNTSIIKDNPSRYSASYIYRVAYNCMYCICHDLKSVKDRWENEIPDAVSYEGEELSLFDTCKSGDGLSAEDEFYKDNLSEQFWEAIEDLDKPAEEVIELLMEVEDIGCISSKYEDALESLRYHLLKKIDGLDEALDAISDKSALTIELGSTGQRVADDLAQTAKPVSAQSEGSLRRCAECGKLFVGKGIQKYCTDAHYRPCPICGKPVLAKYLSDPARRCSDCKSLRVAKAN